MYLNNGKISDNQLLDMFRNAKTRNLAFNQIINQNQERVYWLDIQ